jgi:hypothetical protein
VPCLFPTSVAGPPDAPSFDLGATADELYADVGSIAVTLINEKNKRISRSVRRGY